MKHALRTLKTIVTSLAVAAMLALPAGAADPRQTLCEGSGGTWTGSACESAAGQPQVFSTFRLVANVLLFVLGAVAVIMIIIGGIKYVTSNGEQSQVASAKNTILYAVIGIIVAFVAYAIVNFVTSQISKGNTYNPAVNRSSVAGRLPERQQI
jgi:uncharacterized membrane protein YjgN (DUF898 family)